MINKAGWMGAAALGFALLAAAGQVEAAPFTVTYAGTVGESHDVTGVFGDANTSLDGESFSLVFTGDTATGYAYSDAYEQNNYGGSAYAHPSVNSAILTINGFSASFAGSYFSQNYAYRSSDSSQLQTYSQDYFDDGLRYASNYVYATLYESSGNVFPPLLTTPFSIDLTTVAGLSRYGDFQWLTYTGTHGNHAYGNLTFERVDISAVPLPGALPLFASALGLGGLFGYRRKRRAAMAAA